MDSESKPIKVGPLFAEEDIVNKEPEVVWDDNDESPANEARWLAYFKRHDVAMTASEEQFITEYERRREIAKNG